MSAKRAARDALVQETIAREHDERASKKPRFDARNPSRLAAEDEETDLVIEADEIGKGGLRTKRNAVRLEGYESDSSSENFDERAAERARATKRAERDVAMKSKDEEDADMFADVEEAEFPDGDEDEEAAKEGKKRKKEVRFMDVGEIEGQVMQSRSGGHVSADFRAGAGAGTTTHSSTVESSEGSDVESEGEADEEERARTGSDDDAAELGAGAKKRHAPKVDAFNMRDEAEEGKFDSAGNFVRHAADPFAEHDSWLTGSTKAEMKRARAAQQARDEARRRREKEDDAVSTGEVLAALIRCLRNGETVLEALQRLGRAAPKTKAKNWSKHKQYKRTTDDTTMPDVVPEMTPEQERAAEAETRRRAAVEAITASADRLLTLGQTDVYDQERGLLMRQYRRETGEDWNDDDEDNTNGDDNTNAEENENGNGTVQAQWEFRWRDGRDGSSVHGPYDASTMAAWKQAGYFGDGVEFRRVGDEGSAWAGPIVEFN